MDHNFDFRWETSTCWYHKKSSPFHEYFNSIDVNFNCSITDFVPLSNDRLELFQENINSDVFKDVLTVPFTGTINPVPFQYSVWTHFLEQLIWTNLLTNQNSMLKFFIVKCPLYSINGDGLFFETVRCTSSKMNYTQSQCYRLSRLPLLFLKNYFCKKSLVDIFSIQWTCRNTRNIWKILYILNKIKRNYIN